MQTPLAHLGSGTKFQTHKYHAKLHLHLPVIHLVRSRLQLKCDGTRAETRFPLSAKRTSPFKSEGASIQSTTGSRGVRISGSNAGYTMFRGSVKGTGYPLHSPVSPSLPPPTVRHRVPSRFNCTLPACTTCCNIGRSCVLSTCLMRPLHRIPIVPLNSICSSVLRNRSKLCSL